MFVCEHKRLYISVCIAEHMFACISGIWVCGYVPTSIYKCVPESLHDTCVENICMPLCLIIPVSVPKLV